MKTTLILSSVLTLLFVLPASSQTASGQPTRCPLGVAKTFDGRCTNPGLSSAVVTRSVRMNQMMINQYAYPLPLSSPHGQLRGFDVNRFENSPEGSGSVNPFPLSCHPLC